MRETSRNLAPVAPMSQKNKGARHPWHPWHPSLISILDPILFELDFYSWFQLSGSSYTFQERNVAIIVKSVDLCSASSYILGGVCERDLKNGVKSEQITFYLAVVSTWKDVELNSIAFFGKLQHVLVKDLTFYVDDWR